MKKLTKLISSYLLTAALTFTAFASPVLAAGGDAATTSKIKISDIETKVDDFMDQHIGVSTPGAAVAVVKDGEIVLSKGYGYANLEHKTPVTPSTVFEYGSISKLFVWTSVMQLVEQGKIDLDTDIRAYLPESFNKQWKTQYPITMRNIMNHSSGFGEYPFDLIDLSGDRESGTLAQIILDAHPKQYFKPGTASVYSNYATALAGYVVECIDGAEFYEYQKAQIFDVIGMKDSAGQTAWKDNPGILEEKANGYTLDGKGGFVDTGWSYVGLYPAGSISGTAEDLARFAVALMPGEGQDSPLFKDQQTRSTMLTSSYETEVQGTAHGFFEFDSADGLGKAFGHGGNTASFSAQFAFVPEDSFGIIVLTNASSEMDITMGLQDLLIGNSMQEKVVSKDTDILPDVSVFENTYVSMRRPEGTPSEFISYLAPVTVKVVAENSIVFNMSGFEGTYLQTSPYTFELIESTHPIFNTIFYKLIFQMDGEGNPAHMSFGKGQDMSALTGKRNMPTLIANIATIICAVLFFLIVPVILIIQTVRRRKKGISNKEGMFSARAGLTVAGTAMMINNVILLVFIVSNQFIQYMAVKPFQVMNYVFSGLALGCMIWGGIKWKEEKSVSQKIWFAATVIILISFICVLVTWNIFTILA